jgi:hypothetical protein
VFGHRESPLWIRPQYIYKAGLGHPIN